MKVKKGKEVSVTQPLLKDLLQNDVLQRSKVQSQMTLDKINGVASTPLQQPDLYQDPGSGYNTNFVFPQD